MPHPTIHYQPISDHDYEALMDKSGAYCVHGSQPFGNAYTLTYQEFLVDGKRHREDGPARILSDGTTVWFHNDKVHRVGAPAVTFGNGTQEWYEHGVQHRTDGPAVTKADGSCEWRQKGQLHREDGPAIETPAGFRRWYLNGKQVAKKDMPYVEAGVIEKAIKSATKSAPKKSTLGMAL